MKKLLLAALVATSLAASFNARADTNLVVNGSFEDQAQAPGTYGIYQAIHGWTTTAGSGIEIRNALVGTAFAGNNFVELDSNSNSTMAQTLTTVAGAHYLLSFEYSARPGISAASNPIEALWNGVSIATVTADGTALSNTAWNLYSYSLTGTGSDVLSFRATGIDDTLGGSLDAVSVTTITAVPEPSTWVLMTAGFALIGLSIRRRRPSR